MERRREMSPSSIPIRPRAGMLKRWPITTGTAWHAKTSGDFDGNNGKADIAWQNDDGSVMLWLMNGTTIAQNTTLATNPGTAWHLKATGDLDGNGTSDLVFQNDNGAVMVWEM